MADELFITAIKNGNYISINEFGPRIGEDCNCTCPECGDKVRSNVTSKSEALINGRRYTNHFSHINKNSICKGGYCETELHLFAKKIIEENNYLKVPGKKYHYPDTLKYTSAILEKAFSIEKYNQFRPDIIITSVSGEKIIIEIVVTNPLSETKAQLFKETEFKCLIIDLSRYQKNNINSLKDIIKNDILEETKDIKKWVWPTLIQDIDTITEAKKVENSKNASSENTGCLLFLCSIFVFTFLLLLFT